MSKQCCCYYTPPTVPTVQTVSAEAVRGWIPCFQYKLPQRSCSYDVTLQVFEPSSNEGACKQNVSNIAQIRQLTVETYSTLLIFFLVDDYRVLQSWLRALASPAALAQCLHAQSLGTTCRSE